MLARHCINTAFLFQSVIEDAKQVLFYPMCLHNLFTESPHCFALHRKDAPQAGCILTSYKEDQFSSFCSPPCVSVFSLGLGI